MRYKSKRLPLFPFAIFFFFVFLTNANATYNGNVIYLINQSFTSAPCTTSLCAVKSVQSAYLNGAVAGDFDDPGFYNEVVNTWDMWGLWYNGVTGYEQGYLLNSSYYGRPSNITFGTGQSSNFQPNGFNVSFCNGDWTTSCITVFQSNKTACAGITSAYTDLTYATNLISKMYFDRIKFEMGPRCAASPNGMSELRRIYFLFEYENLTDNDISLNSMPDIEINDLKSVYCFNESNNIYRFYLNATDEESDTIYYHSFWNNDFDNTIIVDSFTDPDYVMEENGWAFDVAGCGYDTDSEFLSLNSSCDNVQMIKWLYAGELSSEIDIDFNAWTYYNTSNVYEIWNWNNEKVLGLQMASYIDNYDLGPYTNFSYWNGTEYLYFGTSYYFGLFSITYDMNSTTVHYCINGLDEPSYNDCNLEFYEELHGTTDNIPGKFYMKPQYDSYFVNIPYVLLDELRYFENPDSISWELYSAGDFISHLIEEQGQEILTVYVTDTPHLDSDFDTFEFPITIGGICLEENQFNDTDISLIPITDETIKYIDAFDNGRAQFNYIFYLLMFIVFVILLIQFSNFALALIATGLPFLVAAFLMSGNYTQMITSATLIGVGISILIAKGF